MRNDFHVYNGKFMPPPPQPPNPNPNTPPPPTPPPPPQHPHPPLQVKMVLLPESALCDMLSVRHWHFIWWECQTLTDDWTVVATSCLVINNISSHAYCAVDLAYHSISVGSESWSFIFHVSTAIPFKVPVIFLIWKEYKYQCIIPSYNGLFNINLGEQ